jgi:hypothetical protein
MKKTIITSIAAFAMLFMVSCSGSSGPEATATDFVNALMKKDWEKAKTLSTEESASTIDMIKGFAQNTPDSAAVMKFEIVKEKTKIEGDGASVVAKDENGLEMPMKLKKIEGKWKVDYSMEAIMGDFEDTMSDAMESMTDMADSISIDMDETMEAVDKAATEMMK